MIHECAQCGHTFWTAEPHQCPGNERPLPLLRGQARLQHVADIVAGLRTMSDSEIEIMREVVVGIEAGRHEHGTMDLTKDRRNFKEEAWQEIRDLVFYLATITVKARNA